MTGRLLRASLESEFRARLGKVRFCTFIVDPPTMLLFGAGATLLAEKFVKNNKKFVLAACAVFQLIFWIAGPMMYFDHPFFAKQGLGNDFMWNGYLMGLKAVQAQYIPTYHNALFNTLALIGWLTQPLFLYWGVQLGYKIAAKRNLTPRS